VYNRNAMALGEALRKEFGGVEVLLNPAKPRRNSFEITLVTQEGKEVVLWSGIRKGPPRRLKFPDPHLVLEIMRKMVQ
ncbi:selenoprotein H, partial [Mustelus asterias]